MAAEVRDVLAVADAVAGPLLLVVGHSSGAVVALQSALAAPSRFAGLVRARAALDSGEPGRAIAIHLREIVGMSRLAVAGVRRVPPIWQVVRGYAAAQITDDEAIESLGVGLDRYASLDLPVLLLGGERSPAFLRVGLEALAAVLPRPDPLVVLAGQGHMANLRAPGEVARAVASFAGRVTG
jgi:pimeloyl-ACP methyl ester carboxylesterase